MKLIPLEKYNPVLHDSFYVSKPYLVIGKEIINLLRIRRPIKRTILSTQLISLFNNLCIVRYIEFFMFPQGFCFIETLRFGHEPEHYDDHRDHEKEPQDEEAEMPLVHVELTQGEEQDDERSKYGPADLPHQHPPLLQFAISMQ